MNQRIPDTNLSELLAVLPEHTIHRDLALDLRDARARIAELEKLSASQEEALSLADRGKL